MNGCTEWLYVKLKLQPKLINRKPFQSLHMKKIRETKRRHRNLQRCSIWFWRYSKA